MKSPGLQAEGWKYMRCNKKTDVALTENNWNDNFGIVEAARRLVMKCVE